MGKRKFTAEQARETLLSTGLQMLESVGPAGVATVSLAEAINRSGVPRPSAYRVFGGGDLDPQSSFQEQLVLRVIEHLNPNVDFASLHDVVAPLLAQANDSEPSPTAEHLTELLVQVTRRSAEVIIDFMMTDPHCGVHLAAMALIRTGTDSARIEEAVAAHRDRVAVTSLAFFRDLMGTFGLRLRPGWSDNDLFNVINDATIGAVLAAKSAPNASATSNAPSWLAATYVALTALATEPDPRRVVSAQPMEMLSVTPSELLATV